MKKIPLLVISLFLFSCTNSIETLVITRDQKIPYRLCASIQQVDKNSIFLFIPNDKKKPYRVVATNRSQTFNIEESKFFDFINFINPRRIILLGNERLVPYKIVDGIKKTKIYPGPLSIYLVDDDNWLVNSWEIAEIYENPYIGELFEKVNLDELKRFELQSKSKVIAPARTRVINLIQ